MTEKLVIYSVRRFDYLDALIEKLTEQYLADNSVTTFNAASDEDDTPPTIEAPTLQQFLLEHMEIDEDDDELVASIKASAAKRKCHELNRLGMELLLLGMNRVPDSDCLEVVQVDIPDVVSALNKTLTQFGGVAFVGLRGAVETPDGTKLDLFLPTAYWHGHYISIGFVCDLDDFEDDVELDIVPPRGPVHVGTAALQ